MQPVYTSSNIQYSSTTILANEETGSADYIYLLDYNLLSEKNLINYKLHITQIQIYSGSEADYNVSNQTSDIKLHYTPVQTYSGSDENYEISQQYYNLKFHYTPIQIYSGSNIPYRVSDQYSRTKRYYVPVQVYSGSDKDYKVSTQYDLSLFVRTANLQRNESLGTTEEYILWIMRGRKNTGGYKYWRTRATPTVQHSPFANVNKNTVEINGRLHIKNTINSADKIKNIFKYNNEMDQVDEYTIETIDMQGNISNTGEQIKLQSTNMKEHSYVSDEWLMRGRSEKVNKYNNWRSYDKPEKLKTISNVVEDSIENSGRIYVKRE